ncbi:MAG: VWA domain-containing protein [Ktedonobacteraceae bacterium]|nr:VWA domain-containing protein [Ktedonobacteraceae bacterium]
MYKKYLLSFLLLFSVVLAACGPSENNQPSKNGQPANYVDDPKVLNIIAGSEQQAILDTIVVPWCRSQGITCNYTLKGSVDQARLLAQGNSPYDVFWFASTVFQQVGDRDGRLKSVKPMFISPLVYAGWKSEMQKLGFVGHDVSIAEILKAVESHQTTTWLTNPSQSNSGATVFFAFLNYFAGNGPGEALTMQQLNSKPVEDGITRFIRAMDQTPPSTGTLMNGCVSNEARCRTLFVYEALVIEKNQELIKQGHEPLYVVYPKDSLAIADAPMGFLPHNGSMNAQKEQTFQKLQQYLLSSEGQQKVMHIGRRPATSIGLSLTNPDLSVFNPDWGIKANLSQQPITYPAADVIEAALGRYQTAYRQPVHAIYCLDGSGSMAGNNGWNELDSASQLVFDQAKAKQYYLQTHPEDLTSVMIFNGDVAAGPWTVQGDNATQLLGLYNNIHNFQPGDGTNMYSCLLRAVDLFNQQKNEQRKRLIILMTDGQSETGKADQAINALKSINIPVISIAFGKDADTSQLQQVADASHGSVVNQANLVDALKEATGYK